MSGYVRQPAVAGQFYSADPRRLTAELRTAYEAPRGPGGFPTVGADGPRRLLALVAPHAGYVYSAPVAAFGYAALAADGRPDTVVIIGPNHGWGPHVSAIQTSGAWRTPLGEAAVDEALATELAAALPGLQQTPGAFDREHSLEVQLPFLQQLYGESFRFVPVMMLEQEWPAARELGEALAQVLRGRNAVIVASTDMTHQEPRQAATAQDRVLADRIAALDAEGLLRERARRGISMCGYGPTAAALAAARVLGATRAEILRYGDSAEAQPMDTVVGYLCAAVYRDEQAG